MRALDASEWGVLVKAARRIAATCEDFGTFSCSNGTKNPHITIDSVCPFEYSTFTLLPKPVSFVHSRTNRDVFDLPVTMMMLVAKRHYPEWIKITSDGKWDEWEEARVACVDVFGYTMADFAAAKRDFDELLDPEDRPL